MRPVLIAALLVAASATPAAAESSKKAPYAYDQVWPASVRFLRLDEGVDILEKDSDAGYVMFELEDEGKPYRGALEVIRLGERQVKLVLRIADRPSYMELGILNRLTYKLKRDLGPAPRTPKKPKPKPDDQPKPDDEPKAPADGDRSSP